jgi:GNAT superfamily N-acetyltransferase
MNRDDILQRLDEERQSLAYDGEFLDRLPHITRLRGVDGSFYSIASSSLTAATADAAVAAEIDHHRALDVSFEWKLYSHDEPRDLIDRLRARGFAVGPAEAVMIFDLTQPHSWVAEPLTHRVLPVQSLDQIQTFRQLAEIIFEKEYTLTSTALTQALQTGSTQHRAFIAYSNDAPVAIARLYTHPRSLFAGLFGGGTLSSHRGQGFYRALVAARARDARSAGARYLRVDALPTSRPILEKMGFEQLTLTWPCDWTP